VAQAACFDAVGKLIKDKKNPEALARAKAGFQAADTADKVLGEEAAQLKAQADKSPAAANLLGNIERQLGSLRTANGQLAARIKDLEAVVAKASDKVEVAREVQAQAVNSRITLLLTNGEVEEALAAFDQLLTLVPEQAAEIKGRKEKLATEWKPKDDEHAKARQYLLATWPALTTAQDLKDSLARLRTDVETCKKRGDKYAFRKLLTVLGGFEAKLTELTRDLDPNADADRKTIEDVKVVREVVAKIEAEIVEYLKANP
jgi:tetratricopeptide (TPR) repeat protein